MLATKVSPFRTISGQNGVVRKDVSGSRHPTYNQWKQSWNGNRFPPPPSGAVLYYPGFPYTGTTIKDFSGSGNDGAITGATWVRLPSGLWVLSFDGNDTVTLGNPASLQLTTFSIGFWIELASTYAANEGIFEFDSVQCRCYNSQTSPNNISVRWRYADLTYSTHNLFINQPAGWTYVGMTYDVAASQLLGYYNGALSLTANSVTQAATTSTLKLGLATAFNTLKDDLWGFRVKSGAVWVTDDFKSHYQQERSWFGV